MGTSKVIHSIIPLDRVAEVIAGGFKTLIKSSGSAEGVSNCTTSRKVVEDDPDSIASIKTLEGIEDVTTSKLVVEDDTDLMASSGVVEIMEEVTTSKGSVEDVSELTASIEAYDEIDALGGPS